MKVTFLGQGFESASVNAIGNYLIKYLKNKSFKRFTAISAFASEAGIYGLSDYIKSSNLKVLIIVGIDQGGTSKEALEEISRLNTDGYIYYQKEQPIFHPKIYLFEGPKEIKLILGSSNLTSMGLFTNVETSLLIEFEINDKPGQTLLRDLKKYYNTLFNLTDQNLFKINNSTINDFILKGLIPDEATRKANYHKKNVSTVSLSTIKIKVPGRTIAKIPSSFPRKNRSVTTLDTTTATTLTAQVVPSTTTLSLRKLIWQSGPLTERDLTIPKGKNTNQTGSMLLKKGLLTGIDQRHYFRDVIFSSLAWTYNTRRGATHLEKAIARIRLIINKVDYGVFHLVITHNPRTNTKAYKQKNSMTSISWGEARKLIAKRSLIGKSANLYLKVTKTSEYVLVIG